MFLGRTAEFPLPIPSVTPPQNEFRCGVPFDRCVAMGRRSAGRPRRTDLERPACAAGRRREAARQAPLHGRADRAPDRHLHLEAPQLGHAPPHAEEIASPSRRPESRGKTAATCARPASRRRAIRAVLENRVGPFQHCSYLLTDYIVGTSLYRLMRFERPSAEFVEHLAAASRHHLAAARRPRRLAQRLQNRKLSRRPRRQSLADRLRTDAPLPRVRPRPHARTADQGRPRPAASAQLAQRAGGGRSVSPGDSRDAGRAANARRPARHEAPARQADLRDAIAPISW